MAHLQTEDSGDHETVVVEDGDDQAELTEIPIPTHTDASIQNSDWSIAENRFDDGFGTGHLEQRDHSDDHTCLSDVRSDIYASTVVETVVSSLQAPVDLEPWRKLARECNWKLPVKHPVLPWERGIAALVTGSSYPKLNLLPYRSLHIQSVIEQHEASNGSFSTHVTADSKLQSRSAWQVVAKRIQSLESKTPLETRREYALSKWKLLLQQDPQHCAVGRTLLSDVFALKDDSQLSRTIEDVFCHKSTSTLLKRSSSLTKFVVWLKSTGKQVYPIQEASVYEYMYSKAGVSPSFATNLKEALNFAHGTLGIDGARESAVSARVAGFCRKRILDRRPIKQAQVLTVVQVARLESIMTTSIDNLDKCFIGHSLFCLYARARWSDALYFKSIVVDNHEDGSGFIQCDTLVSKTSSTLIKKRRFLPLTAILRGVSSDTWAYEWLDARKACSLPEPDGKQPNIRTVLKNGLFGSTPLNSSDASKWLRDVLIMTGSPRSDVINISTHSLKATTLSWCAKAGVSEERRRLLGYHTQPGSIALLHYSRDALAGPLRDLESVVDSIRQKIFFPDATRSGYFVPEQTGRQLRVPQQNKLGDRAELDSEDQEDDCESAEESGSNEGSEDELLAKGVSVAQDIAKVRRAKHAGDSLFIHSRWKTIHKSHNETEHKLACGRLLMPVYKKLFEYPSFDYSKCTSCFGS
jgi:hypothetical protein